MRTILPLIAILLGACTSTEGQVRAEFDWMPNDLLWQHNIRDCRSQPQCNAADLFRRT